MENTMFRLLRADEIDCRVQSVYPGKGCTLLLYKDARCDMNILDEMVGPFNWQRTHSRDNANCTVSIWNGEQWVSKEDTGAESNTEAQKGLASDSFKRACFNWGIGRELYTAPFIWIKADKAGIQEGRNGKPQVKTKFEVTDIEYEDQRISYLEITGNGETVFVWGKHRLATPPTPKPSTPQPPKPYTPQNTSEKPAEPDYRKLCIRTWTAMGKDPAEIADRFGADRSTTSERWKEILAEMEQVRIKEANA